MVLSAFNMWDWSVFYGYILSFLSGAKHDDWTQPECIIQLL